MWLDFAEDQARRRKQVFLKDWETKLEEFLVFNERAVLPNAGSISKDEADARAEAEYERFAARRRALLEAEGERTNLKSLEDIAEPRPPKNQKKQPPKKPDTRNRPRAMKLHFESNLDYQLAAIESVCDLFRGQEICRTEFTMSLGGGAADDATRSAIANARSQGSLVLVAAGNHGRQAVSFPASDSRSIAISAMGRTDTLPDGVVEQGDILFPPMARTRRTSLQLSPTSGRKSR